MKQYKILLITILLYLVPVGLFIYFLFDMIIQHGDMAYWVLFLLSLPFSAISGLLSAGVIFFSKKDKTKPFRVFNLILMGVGLLELLGGALGYMLLYIVLA